MEIETDILREITEEKFRQLMDSQFDICFLESVILPAKLLEITSLSGYSPAERKPFSIVFLTNQKTEYYNQNTYRVKNKSIGEIDLFLVPIGPNADGMRYQAVFS